MRDVDRTTVPIAHLRAFALRALVLAGVWWALSEGGEGLRFGLVLALLVAALSLLHTPPAERAPRLHRLPAFTIYFTLQSLRAGWDVACRTVHPRLPLQPQLLRLPLRLPAGAPSWWLMMVISLLPGTLSVHLEGTELELHCLDCTVDVIADVREAEAQLALLFGYTLIDSAEQQR